MPTPISEVRALLDSADATEATDAALALLEGAVIDVDYVETADREGLSIPAGSYGQKSGIPYFGNSPLSEQINQRFDFDSSISNFGADSLISAFVGGFTIPASSAIDEKSWVADVELSFDCSPGGELPSGGDEIYLLVRLGSGVSNLTEGSWIKVTPSAIFERQRFRILIQLTETSGQLRPTLTAASKESLRASTINSAGDVFPFNETTIVNDTSLLADSGEATSLRFYIVSDQNEAGYHIITMTGSINVITGQIQNLNLS